MEQKPLLLLLIVLLGCSHLLLLDAGVPSRKLLWGTSSAGMVDQYQMNRGAVMDEEFVHGRMDIETNDYPGSGANNHHDPKTPERG